ncbi:MAG: hypothetical protein AAF141_10355 [Pseudomonadota bacterium]
MANIFIVGITSASLSFMTVVGLASLTLDASHAQGAETTSSVAALIAPRRLPELETDVTGERPKMDRTLRAFAVERLQEKLGTGLRDSVSADDDALPMAQRNITPPLPEAQLRQSLQQMEQKPKRLPRII